MFNRKNSNVSTLCLVTEARYTRVNVNSYRTDSSIDGEFLERYYAEFDKVLLYCRKGAPTSGESNINVSGKLVLNFQSSQVFFRVFQNILLYYFAMARGHRLIYRLPTAAPVFILGGLKKYFVELIGDPEESFKHSGKSGRFVNVILMYLHRRMISQARGVAFVTESFLQKKYLKEKEVGRVFGHYSSISLNKDYLVPIERNIVPVSMTETNILIVGSLHAEYKGFKDLFVFLDKCKNIGIPNVTWCGDGKYLGYCVAEVSKRSLENKVSFVGKLPKDALLEQYRTCDLVISFSHTEGLPRVIIEAMATGAVVFARPVGGVGELIDSGMWFETEDELIEKILILLRDKKAFEAQIDRNRKRAQDYGVEALALRRNIFYKNLNDLGIR